MKINTYFYWLLRNFHFLLAISVLTIGLYFTENTAFAVHDASSTRKYSCLESYTTAFDQIDHVFEHHLQENLESTRSNSVTGTDNVDTFSPMMQGYECSLTVICNMVEMAEIGVAAKKPEGLEDGDILPLKLSVTEKGCNYTDEVPFEITGLDETGDPAVPIKKLANVENALELFHVPDAFTSCQPGNNTTAEKLAFHAGCQEIVKVKVKLKTPVLAQSLKRSASRKNLGYISAKLNDLHAKMNLHSVDGLVYLTRRFTTKFNEVLGKIKCTVPITQTAG
jgi:hypothetical protein